MALVEFQGYILPDWMVYSFFALIGLIGVVGFIIIKRRFSHPDDIQFIAEEYLPSGIIPKTYRIKPEDVGSSHFIIREGEKERHVMHSHPWVYPGGQIARFSIPFGSNKADSPEEMFHRNRNVRTPFPLVDAQTDALGRIQSKSMLGTGWRKNWFTWLIIGTLGFLAGMAYMSYSHGIPI